MIGDYIWNIISQIFTPTGASWAIVLFTAYFLRKQIKDSNRFNQEAHEEHRRATACDVIHKWSINLTREESVC